MKNRWLHSVPLGSLRRLGSVRGRLGPTADSEVPIPDCPPSWTGCGSLHLSDFHLGFPSRGERAVHRAVRWAPRASRTSPRSRAISCRGRVQSRGCAMLLDRLPSSFAVLGNHDFAISRDPFSKPSALNELGATTLLADEARTVELRGRRVQIVGGRPTLVSAGHGAARTPRRSRCGSPDPALPFSERDRQAAGRCLRPRPRRASPRAARSAFRTDAGRSGLRTCAGPTRRGSTAARVVFCTSRPGSALLSFRSGSSRGRKQQSSSSELARRQLLR